MAQLVLSNVGQYAGGRFLPNGVSVLGRQISGEALGQTIGSLAGAAIDQHVFAPRLEGPRVPEIHVTQSREGASIANVYGRMRVGGSVIWAARFSEHKGKSGGKGGPKVSSYAYTLSFAVALCEGEASQVTRIWANGEAMDLSRVNWRFYPGSEDQLPDALIEAVEGEGMAPAYRGTAYVMFEDLPLEAFGNRMPQLSFEVERTVGGGSRLEAQVTGLNLIPGSGEFAYATQIIQREVTQLEYAPENMNNGAGEADFAVSLEQMLATFPNLSHVNLVVGWFGDSLDCDQCQIHPGVERRDRRTHPLQWSVAGRVREGAYLVSQDDQGRPRYGGTPDDASVKQAIATLKAHGLRVTLYPFLYMDTPGLDWRGRISCAEGHDGTLAASDDVAAFFGTGNDWRYRRFIRHYAELAADSGVDDFLIGSEMVGLTRVRSGSGAYPAVTHLKDLAAECRLILGPGVKLSYAADWTEYGAHLPDDGTGDVDFPLDELWADVNIDFIGLDWYPPLSDWRDGGNHLDALASHSAHDAAYLASNIEGGEGFDWYYADADDRAAQQRVAIDDTSHGEDWLFRQKDIRNWWANAHRPRPGGVRSLTPTPWTPASKPVRFVEFGCPAVDKGANQPNVFYDPKSAESALPHHSDGTRDDLIQRRAIEAFASYWSGDPMLDTEAPMAIWAWDMRPWPNWPMREDVWSDGGNWRFGHWINGRAGLAMLGEVVADIAGRAGVTADVSGLNGIVTGFGLSGVMSARDGLESLKSAFGFVVNERPEGLVFRMPQAVDTDLTDFDIAAFADGSGYAVSRLSMDKPPNRMRLGFIDAEADHLPGAVMSAGAASDPVRDISLALVMDRDQASDLAENMRQQAQAMRETIALGLSPAKADLEPGDRFNLHDGVWRAVEVRDADIRKVAAVRADQLAQSGLVSAEPGPQTPAIVAGPAAIVMADAPAIPGAAHDSRPIVFAASRPWTGSVEIMAGLEGGVQTSRVQMDQPSAMGQLMQALPPGPVSRWHEIGIEVEMLTSDELVSHEALAVLNGANLALVGNQDAGWELIQFRGAELIAPSRYRLHGLLRGGQGSDDKAAVGANAGDWFLPLSSDNLRMDVDDVEQGLDLMWSAERGGILIQTGGFVWTGEARRLWSPVILTPEYKSDGVRVSWLRRSASGADGWDVAEPRLSPPERYLLTLTVEGQLVHEHLLETPTYLWSQADMAVDAPSGGAAEFCIRQLAPDGALGHAARITVAI